MIRRKSLITSLLLTLALVAASCGSDDGTGGATNATPLATTTTMADTTTTTGAATTSTVATYDLVEAVLEYTSTIPEGWMAVSDITAFKDAIAVGALLIDVREISEYEAGHLPGAINIPLRTISDNLDMIPTDRQVFVYCKSGYRAALAGSSLRMLGYDNVLIYPPGWVGWTEAGEEVSTDVPVADIYSVPDIAPEMFTAVDDFLNGIPEGYYTAGDTEAVKAAIDAGAFLLDVRTTAEYDEGFIPGAVNVNLRAIPDNIEQIPTDRSVIHYCKSGFRAALALPVLHVLGFDNDRAYTGSYLAWIDASEPIEIP